MSTSFRIYLFQMVSALSTMRIPVDYTPKTATGVNESVLKWIPVSWHTDEPNKQEIITFSEEEKSKLLLLRTKRDTITEDEARNGNKTNDYKQLKAVREIDDVFVDSSSSSSKHHTAFSNFNLTFTAADCENGKPTANETAPSIRIASSSCNKSAGESFHGKGTSLLEDSLKRYQETKEFVERRYFQNGTFRVGEYVIKEMVRLYSCAGRCGSWFNSPCSCSYHCLIYDTCCLDFGDLCMNSDRNVDVAEKWMYSVAGNVACFRDEGGRFMVFRCPGDTGDDSSNGMKQLYTGVLAIQKALENAPVTDERTGLVFRSRRIFDCYASGADTFRAWEPLIRVQKRDEHYSDLNKTTAQVLDFSNVIYKQPLGIERHTCNFFVLDSCPKGYPDGEVKRQCDSGPIAYVLSYSLKSSYSFKNIACVECHMDSLSQKSDFKLHVAQQIIEIKGLAVLRALMKVTPESVSFSAYQSRALPWTSMTCSLSDDTCRMDNCKPKDSSVAEDCRTKFEIAVGVRKNEDDLNATVTEVQGIAEGLLCYMKEVFAQSNIAFPVKGVEKPIDVYATPTNFIIAFVVSSFSTPYHMRYLGDGIARYLVFSYYQGRFKADNMLKLKDSLDGDNAENGECPQDDIISTDGLMNVTDRNVVERVNVTNGNVRNQMNVCPKKEENTDFVYGCHITTSVPTDSSPAKDPDSESDYFPVCTIIYTKGNSEPEYAISKYCVAGNVWCLKKNAMFSMGAFTSDPKNRVASRQIVRTASELLSPELKPVPSNQKLGPSNKKLGPTIQKHGPSNQKLGPSNHGGKKVPLREITVQSIALIIGFLSLEMWR